MYLKTDPSCHRITDPDMVLNSILGLDINMAPGGGADYSAWSSDTNTTPSDGPGTSNLHDPHGNRSIDINTDSGCYRAMGPDPGL